MRGTRYHRHPTQNIGVGCCTDDTQMSLAIAEAIMARDEWTPRRLATHFVAVYKRIRAPVIRESFKSFWTRCATARNFCAASIRRAMKAVR
ncbi:MAG: ADP-ribosylglycohydrolase family protein [Akkermansiaceae bacterium]|nr:ADP-ribosylglycohydrolase family protein [Armatimonadota bacterium]